LYDVVLVRYGEITLKSDRLRKKWEHILMRNIEAQTGGKAFKRAARIIVVGGELDAFGRVFGIKSYSPALEVPADIEKIKEAALSLYSGEESFAIRCRRVTKDFYMNSMDVNREVGAYVKERTGARVDLENPTITIGIEIIGKRAYIFRDVFPGPGGLPAGVSGKVVCLISGGFDSPIAAWYAMRRGLTPIFLHADMGKLPLVKTIVGRLSKWLPDKPRLFYYDHASLLRKLVRELRHPGDTCLLCKALMLRQAERLAREVGADGIVTGENIGQVATQTLQNMGFLSSFVKKVILRPILCFDKDDTVRKARELGLYDLLAKGSAGRCPFVPRKPATRPKWYIREIVERAELPDMVEAL